MMTIIIDPCSDRMSPKFITWHVGGSFPELHTGRIVKIEADGHELQWLQVAINFGAEAANTDYRTKVHGARTP